MPQIQPRRARTAAAAVAAIAVGSLALTTTPAATAAESAAAPRLSVLSYNAFLMSKSLYPNWGQDHRAAEIPKASWYQGHDVVVLQEAFDNGASDALKANSAAQYPYQTPVVGRSKSGWDATGGAYSSTAPEDGGVTIVSKWPIVRKEQVVYKDACGADWWSNKGFAYVVLNVNGTKVHVVGTHAQSTDPGCGAGEAAEMRARQFRNIDAFLDGKNIPASEQVIVAGDMNVDSRTPELATMLANADLAASDTRTGHTYSFDTALNSIANYRYPTDPREDLDYVLYRKGNARPANWENNVVLEQSAPWTVSSWGTSYTYNNLSDHYPLIGR